MTDKRLSKTHDKNSLQPTSLNRRHHEKTEKPNPSRQHLKILNRSTNEWVNVMGTLDTGTEENWIGSHVLNRIGPQPMSMIPKETYTDFQGADFSCEEVTTICWQAVNSNCINDGDFRVVSEGGFDVVIGRIFLHERGIYEFNESNLVFFYKKPSKDDERRIEATSSQQEKEIQQYLIKQPESQAAERQKRRDFLASYRQQPDPASLTVSSPSLSSGYTPAGSGPWQGESPSTYGHSRRQACLMGQPVRSSSIPSGYSSMSTTAMGASSHQKSLASNTSYDTIGRGSSWDVMPPATRFSEKNEASPYIQLRDWICSYCSQRNQASAMDAMICSRCRKEKVVTRRSR